MRTSRAAGLLLALLLVATSVAACSSGGSDDGSGKGSGSSSTTTTEAGGKGDKGGGGDGGKGGGSAKPLGTKLQYVAALTTNLQGVGLAVDKGTSGCLAAAWVDLLGVDRFAEESVPPKEIAKPTFQYAQLHLTHKEALAMIDRFEPCGAKPLDVVLASLGADFTDEQRSCVEENLGGELTRELLARALQGIDLTSEQQRELYALDPLCKLGTTGQGTTDQGTGGTGQGG